MSGYFFQTSKLPPFNLRKYLATFIKSANHYILLDTTYLNLDEVIKVIKEIKTLENYYFGLSLNFAAYVDGLKLSEDLVHYNPLCCLSSLTVKRQQLELQIIEYCRIQGLRIPEFRN